MLVILRFLVVLVVFYSIISNPSFAKLWGISEKEIIPPRPSCTSTGMIQCDKGYEPTCPSGHTPSCIFVGTKHLPACLENSKDQVAFNYYLDKISCQKISQKK